MLSDFGNRINLKLALVLALLIAVLVLGACGGAGTGNDVNDGGGIVVTDTPAVGDGDMGGDTGGAGDSGDTLPTVEATGETQ